jgi:competence protein ComEC
MAGLLRAVAAGGWRAPTPEWAAAHFAMLDVGQGLAAVVETRHHVLVYDTGPVFQSGSDTGALVLEPYLRHRGLRRVDALVVSHDDLDHGGGVASLGRSMPIGRRITSGHALEGPGSIEFCRRGGQWSWDGVSFEWLHPGPDLPPGDNDRSCVLRVRVGPHVLLLTGDIEHPAEVEMQAQGGPGRVDVLTVPHHGSRTSSTQWFVDATQPRWALVPSGHRNRWGFPKPDVVARWEAAGATVIVGSASGAIEFDVHPDRPLAAPRLHRPAQRRLWHDP